jgi:hypothetical protein
MHYTRPLYGDLLAGLLGSDYAHRLLKPNLFDHSGECRLSNASNSLCRLMFCVALHPPQSYRSSPMVLWIYINSDSPGEFTPEFTFRWTTIHSAVSYNETVQAHTC